MEFSAGRIFKILSGYLSLKSTSSGDRIFGCSEMSDTAGPLCSKVLTIGIIFLIIFSFVHLTLWSKFKVICASLPSLVLSPSSNFYIWIDGSNTGLLSPGKAFLINIFSTWVFIVFTVLLFISLCTFYISSYIGGKFNIPHLFIWGVGVSPVSHSYRKCCTKKNVLM